MHRSTRRTTLALALALLAAFAIAGPSVAVDRWVTMYDSSYRPATVTIVAGDQVTFVNDDDLPHDASGNGWRTELLNKGDSDAVTFRRAGTYRYTCTIHPDMRGRIVVRARNSGGSGGVPVPATDAAADPAADPGGTTYGAAVVLALAVLGFGVVLRRRADDRT